jgi:hypothetical protein
MKTNVGGIDRILRYLVGLGPILTGVIRFCPAYLPFGLSSCRSNADPSAKS